MAKSIIMNNPLLCVMVASLVHSIRKKSMISMFIVKSFRSALEKFLKVFLASTPQKAKKRTKPATPNCANAG